jgi:hypothetical protein
LYAADGSHLEPGRYEIEVKAEADRYQLVFSQNEKIKETVSGGELRDGSDGPRVEIPLVGTNYLRSSADPVGTEAERHTSEIGRGMAPATKRTRVPMEPAITIRIIRGELCFARSALNSSMMPTRPAHLLPPRTRNFFPAVELHNMPSGGGLYRIISNAGQFKAVSEG